MATSFCALMLASAVALAAPAGADTAGREAAVAQARRAAELLRRVELAYRHPPFRVTFVQALDSPTFGLEEQARGTVHVVAPGRILWLYDEPRGQKAVMEPDRWLLVSPADREVIIRERDPRRPHPVADLLAGTIDLLHLFRVSIVDEGEDVVRLDLVPTEVMDDVDRVTLEVSPERAEVRSVVVTDPLGSRIVYRLGPRVPEAPLPASALAVEIPEGYAVSRE